MRLELTFVALIMGGASCFALWVIWNLGRIALKSRKRGATRNRVLLAPDRACERPRVQAVP